jgi:acyl-CoA synthetase (AMP-forming)/AMP-acid ligase II
VRIVDDDGADVPPGSGAAGEVVVRGPTVFGGYCGVAVDAAAPAAPGSAGGPGPSGDAWLQPGGWFRTGDVALDHGNGYMTVVDRKKDMVGRVGWGGVGWGGVGWGGVG